MAYKCKQTYIPNKMVFFDDFPLEWYDYMCKPSVSEETQTIIVEEMLEFVHGLPILIFNTFTQLMTGFTALEKMYRRHVGLIVNEVGRRRALTVKDWYEKKFMQVLDLVTCLPHPSTQLYIKIPPIKKEDIETPKPL
jgi:hypothetical protein